MSENNDNQQIIDTIKQVLAENQVILFMKGSPDQPQCGFSATAVKILQACGKPFAFVDILQQPDIRANLKFVTDWPTFPQLIVNGELIGGSDILSELYEDGELQTILNNAAASTANQENHQS